MSARSFVRDAVARHSHEWCVAFLVLATLGAHLAISNLPRDGFIFDEAYYVPAARALIAGDVSNIEHPPLAKALIAVSIRVFADQGFAWRLPSIIAGSLGILLIYLLTRRLADKTTALYAAFLMTFENLWFVHSSIAMLDIVAITLGLWALLLLVRGDWVWAGAVIGLAMLAKETMALLVGVAILFAFLQCPPGVSRRHAARQAATVGFFVAVSAFLVFMAGLQIYDSAYDAFPTSFHHVARMIRHNRGIGSPPLSEAIHPMQWFSGFTPSAYYVTSAVVGKGLRRTYLQYLGQPNLLVVLLVWLALPFSLPLIKQKNPNVVLHTVLLLGSWISFAGVAVVRITYPYYMLVAIPSICVLVAVFLRQCPRRVVVTYGVGVVLWFLFWFPRNLLTLG